MGSTLSRVKECGGSKCKIRGFLPGPHVIDTLCTEYWKVRQAYGCARSECSGLLQLVQIKGDVWTPYASMKSHICLRGTMDNGPVAVVDIDTDNDRRGRVDRGAKPGALRQKAPLYLFFFVG